MRLAIDIAWDASSLDVHCPFNECGTCYYVGREIQAHGQCPLCGAKIGNATGVWPTNQWSSAAADIAFLFDHKRIELATIVAASYLEGCLHAFLWKGMYLIWDQTRWTPREDQDHAGNIKANQECLARIETCFKKHRGWKGRADKLCTRVFGASFDELVDKHVPESRAFITNRENIQKWRNLLLHVGHPMTETWSGDVKDYSLRVTVEFMLQCWEVFRPLQNELVAKVISQRANGATPDC